MLAIAMMLEALAERARIKWFDWQIDALRAAIGQRPPQQRRCLYYKTGSGKSLTALGCLALWGHSECVVIAPPATYPQWVVAGQKLGITVHCMSHALFRMPKTKLSRTMPVIADEFHLFGGHTGKGWKKLNKLAAHLQAPLILASATPNYNDAERVYCIQHVMDPDSCRGGFIAFLYQNCETRPDPFSMTPKVVGFLNFAEAKDYLAALPNVSYLPDDLVYTIQDVPMVAKPLPDLEAFGYNERSRRIIASQMEERHARVNLRYIKDDGFLNDGVYAMLLVLMAKAKTPVLVFAAHSTVADALALSLQKTGIKQELVTGGSTAKQKDLGIKKFLGRSVEVLVGTATLATGTDGLDKVCDTLVILDDTDDDALRRQLIGRIMPRGTDTDASAKQVYRLVWE